MINVTDINDNTPTFTEAGKDGGMDMDIPENIPSGTVRRLPSALDKVFFINNLNSPRNGVLIMFDAI